MLKYFSILLFITVFLFSSYVFSQEKDDEDSLKYETNELVITGTRTYKKIIDIPFSVFSVDKNELKYGRKVSAKDILADVPGLFLQSRYGNSDVRISIRGYGTRSNTGVRGIRILQDGIPESEIDGETTIDAIDFTSLGGVEVVKGNLSSLYANAPGGVVNFISDIYFPENYLTLSNQIGSFGMKQNGVKTGIKSENYKYFLSYSYRNLLGFRQHSNEYRHLVNSVYEAVTGKRSTFSVFGNFVRGLSKLPGSLTKAEYETDPVQARDIAVSQDFKRITQKGRIGLRYRTEIGKGDRYELEITGFGGLKDLENTDNRLYRLSTRYSLGFFLRFTDRDKIFKRENDLTGGIDYQFQTGPVTEYENISGHRGLSVQNQYEEKIGNIGFYLQDQFSLVKNKMYLYLSVRYDKVNYEKSALQFTGFIDTFRVFDKFTPKVGLNYKLKPNIALYTSYGIGFDIPAASELENYPFTSNEGRTNVNPDVQPQRSQNFELGIKGDILNRHSEFMRKIFFDITFFNYIISDEIVPFVISDRTFFRNAAKTNRTGLEIGIKTEPFEGIELTTNYTFTNFRYSEYKARIYDAGGGFTDLDFSGNKVPSVPQHILNFILNYEFRIKKGITGLFQLDADNITRMFTDDRNTENTAPYFYMNSMAGININLKKFTFLAYAGMNNIFDKKYVGFLNINDAAGRYYESGEPRNFYSGLNFTYNF